MGAWTHFYIEKGLLIYMKLLLHQMKTILLPHQRRGVFLIFLGALISAILDTVAVVLMMPFISAIMNPDTVLRSSWGIFASHLLNTSDVNGLLVALSLLFVGLYVFRGAYKIFFNFKQANLIATYRTDLATRLFTFIMNKPYKYHLQHNVAESQRLVSSDTSSCFAMLDQIILAGSCLMVSLGIFAVLFLLQPVFTLILILVVGVFLLFVKKRLKKVINRYAIENFEAQSQTTKWINQSVGGLKSILVKRRQSFFIRQYSNAAEHAAHSSSRYTAIDSAPKVLIDTACMVLMFIVMAIQLGTSGDVAESLPMFATFALAAMRLIPVVGQVTTTINAIGFYRPSLDAVSAMLESNDFDLSDIDAKQDDQGVAKQNAQSYHPFLEQSIEVEHIAFKFDDAQEPLYSDLSLSIPAKKAVAFVGTTGSGKTTLADIILGLQKPMNGHICVDGIDIERQPEWWASMIGYIPQFIYLSDDTIRANVTFGIEPAEIDDALVWECLERAQIADFVRSLPQGVDTLTGENGIRLSGGQRQRIGIARALYTKPQFLLMDEATSALDNDTEKAIVDSINTLSGDITLLIIAHRLTTIQNCDYIYRIENGKATLEGGKSQQRSSIQ